MSRDIRKMINSVKNFNKFVNENDILNLKNILFNIAKQARDHINDKYNLNSSFTNYCDLTSEEVAKLLIKEGIHGEIIYGEYLHQYDNSEPDYYGHTWVQTDDYIIDASREQFDSIEYVINLSDGDSRKYEISKVVSTF